MLNFKKIEFILEELDKKGLVNEFFSALLNINVENFNSYITRYKIQNEFIIDLFNYNKSRGFSRYIFVLGDELEFHKDDNNVKVHVYNLKKLYLSNDKNKKFFLFSTLFFEKNEKKMKENIKKIFKKDIIVTIYKYI